MGDVIPINPKHVSNKLPFHLQVMQQYNNRTQLPVPPEYEDTVVLASQTGCDGSKRFFRPNSLQTFGYGNRRRVGKI